MLESTEITLHCHLNTLVNSMQLDRFLERGEDIKGREIELISHLLKLARTTTRKMVPTTDRFDKHQNDKNTGTTNIQTTKHQKDKQ